ncbi:MAG TPA: alpha/beta fold hydrolase [Aggregicoccus sp.]|nr:alpha/beta fold hydrolase [Aggregicoccus sp.]
MRRFITQLGELQCQVVDSLPEGAEPALAVILCHGFGAPAGDLVPLGAELLSLRPELAGRVRFVFPAALLSLPEMPGARAWWRLPPEVFQYAERDWERYADAVVEGLVAARRALMGVVEAVSSGMGLPLGRIVLGGFSQGAMLATDVALRLEEPPAGLVALSGILITKSDWSARAQRRRGLPVFQSHGRYDDLLPFARAEALRALLEEAGLKVDFVPFDGPHSIFPEVLEGLAAFLAARLAEQGR